MVVEKEVFMKRKQILALIMCLLMLIPCACAGNVGNGTEVGSESYHTELNGTENDSTETDIKSTVSKEVVFMNREGGIVILDIGYDGPILKKLAVAAEYDYEYDEANNKDTLYAFGCHFYPKGDVVEKPDYIYEDKNVYVLSDYKGFGDNYGYDMTIACTMDDLVHLFDNEEFLEKWSVHINPLMRPDILEVLKELGWDENGTKTSGDWYKNNRELVESKIGTDNQITMTVEVEQ